MNPVRQNRTYPKKFLREIAYNIIFYIFVSEMNSFSYTNESCELSSLYVAKENSNILLHSDSTETDSMVLYIVDSPLNDEYGKFNQLLTGYRIYRQPNVKARANLSET